MFKKAPDVNDWREQLGEQTRLDEIEPEGALKTVRSAWALALGADWGDEEDECER